MAARFVVRRCDEEAGVSWDVYDRELQRTAANRATRREAREYATTLLVDEINRVLVAAPDLWIPSQRPR